MPDELRDRLSAAADSSGRSLNAEIVKRLELSLESQAGGREMLSTIVERVIGALTDEDVAQIRAHSRSLNPPD